MGSVGLVTAPAGRCHKPGARRRGKINALTPPFIGVGLAEPYEGGRLMHLIAREGSGQHATDLPRVGRVKFENRDPTLLQI
jgi:hypothetical protein